MHPSLAPQQTPGSTQPPCSPPMHLGLQPQQTMGLGSTQPAQGPLMPSEATSHSTNIPWAEWYHAHHGLQPPADA
eukprot:6337645-Prorocentrum_lima.AAC.1